MLYHNCKGNYGFAMIEVDKVKNYAEHEHLSLDSAFDELYMNKMLTIENEPFNCDKFMEDLLLRNDIELGKDLKCLYDVDFKDSWYNLESMVNDLKIAYCILKYGKFKGSSYAYESEHLYWGRIKQIREFNIALSLDDIQRLILSLSRYDSMVKQGQITNKDVIINQIKNQNENLQKDIEDKEKEMELIEKTRQKEVNEYKEQIESLMKEKNELDIYKQELTDNLYQANNKIKEMNDFISKKYNSLMESLSCEKQKNEELEKKYKKIVKCLKYKIQNLFEENRTMCNLLNVKDREKEQMEYYYQSEIKNMSLINNTIYNTNNSIIP